MPPKTCHDCYKVLATPAARCRECADRTNSAKRLKRRQRRERNSQASQASQANQSGCLNSINVNKTDSRDQKYLATPDTPATSTTPSPDALATDVTSATVTAAPTRKLTSVTAISPTPTPPASISSKLRKIIQNRLCKSIRAQIRRHETTEQLIGCSIDNYKQFIEKQFIQGMTWTNVGQWHIDHIKSLCQFDLTDPLQRSAAFHYTNTRPIWANDNLKKGSNDNGNIAANINVVDRNNDIDNALELLRQVYIDD